MSNTTKKTFYASLVAGAPGNDRLEKWGFELLAADPAVTADLFEGRIWGNSSDGRLKIAKGGGVETIAYLSDLTTFIRYRGVHDATTGLPTPASSTVLPNVAIRAGDRWRVSVAGTIVGIGGGDVVEVGDWIVAAEDAPTDATGFTTEEVNKGDVPDTTREVLAVAALVADTPLTLNTATVTDIDVVSVRNATGEVLDGRLLVSVPTATSIVLTSSVDLADLSVRVIGKG